GKMSPQQIKQLLESLKNEEKKTQKKLNAKKAKGSKVKQEKDW
ncbi:MAG: DNA primase, partial [Flavobacteriaceae bacterium]|nr:DNA primase [Flavobacteriaceae bacterium]